MRSADPGPSLPSHLKHENGRQKKTAWKGGPDDIQKRVGFDLENSILPTNRAVQCKGNDDPSCFAAPRRTVVLSRYIEPLLTTTIISHSSQRTFSFRVEFT